MGSVQIYTNRKLLLIYIIKLIRLCKKKKKRRAPTLVPSVETAEVSSRPGCGHTDSVMYTNHQPQAGLFQAKPSQIWASLPSRVWQGERLSLLRHHVCNVHYQRSVGPVQGMGRAQILNSRQWMLHTAPPAPPVALGWASPGGTSPWGAPV